MSRQETRGELGGVDDSFQARFEQWAATELPRTQAFENQLYSSVKLLREGRISPRDFFEGLIGDGKPLSTILEIDHGKGFIGWYTLERTEDRKLKITSQEVGSIPEITAQVGLNEEGQLIVERVEARYVDNVFHSPGTVEGDFILTDTLELIPKQLLGEELLRTLLNVAPFKQDSDLAP